MTRFIPAVVALPIFAMALWANPAWSDIRNGMNSRVVEEEPWREEEVKSLPDYPDGKNLASVAMKGNARYAYLIDRKSLAVWKDGVVRFVLVVRSGGADDQVTYVGLHCKGRTWKTYAIGQADQTWHQIPKPIWEPVERKSMDNIRNELFRYSVCAGNSPAGDVSQILSNLRIGALPQQR